MAKFEHKPETGSLFRNDKREKESQPNAKGSALVGGIEYWVSAWTNATKDGEPYQSLRFSRKDENTAPRPKEESPDFDDDLPF